MKNTKQCVIIIAAVLAAVLFCSCQSDDMEEVGKPTFKITSFSKEAIEGGYCCKATIQITALTGDYSIDGLIYADNISKIWRNLPYNENISADIHSEGEGKLYFNLFGHHRGNLTIELEWTSKEDRENYIVGRHLSYGFTDDCQVLMLNLKK